MCPGEMGHGEMGNGHVDPHCLRLQCKIYNDLLLYLQFLVFFLFYIEFVITGVTVTSMLVNVTLIK